MDNSYFCHKLNAAALDWISNEFDGKTPYYGCIMMEPHSSEQMKNLQLG